LVQGRTAIELQLGYSTNVHRGETLSEVYRFLGDFTVPIRRRVFGKLPSGLELRFGLAATRALEKPAARERLAAYLEENGLRLFSLNAFPLLDFQARRVKERVYSPDWTERRRVDWTCRLVDILAALLAPGADGSISTLAGTYRPWRHDRSTLDRIAGGYLEVVEALERLEARCGRRIVLAVEPEPDTTLEAAGDVIRFVEDHLLPRAHAAWKRRWPKAQAREEVVRRYFTVNLDTCHFSVLFHEPAAALRQLLKAGIGIGKLHITSAPALRHPYRARVGYDVLRGMDEPRYLHQFCGADAAGRPVWRGRDLGDLPERLDPRRHPAVAEIRSHFHVPLYLKRWKFLDTTQAETFAALEAALATRATTHFVIETYTWPVLAGEDRLQNGIFREFRWLLESLERLGHRVP
jgi:hypothetical protein